MRSFWCAEVPPGVVWKPVEVEVENGLFQKWANFSVILDTLSSFSVIPNMASSFSVILVESCYVLKVMTHHRL